MVEKVKSKNYLKFCIGEILAIGFQVSINNYIFIFSMKSSLDTSVLFISTDLESQGSNDESKMERDTKNQDNKGKKKKKKSDKSSHHTKSQSKGKHHQKHKKHHKKYDSSSLV